MLWLWFTGSPGGWAAYAELARRGLEARPDQRHPAAVRPGSTHVHRHSSRAHARPHRYRHIHHRSKWKRLTTRQSIIRGLTAAWAARASIDGRFPGVVAVVDTSRCRKTHALDRSWGSLCWDKDDDELKCPAYLTALSNKHDIKTYKSVWKHRRTLIPIS